MPAITATAADGLPAPMELKSISIEIDSRSDVAAIAGAANKFLPRQSRDNETAIAIRNFSRNESLWPRGLAGKTIKRESERSLLYRGKESELEWGKND